MANPVEDIMVPLFRSVQTDILAAGSFTDDMLIKYADQIRNCMAQANPNIHDTSVYMQYRHPDLCYLMRWLLNAFDNLPSQ